jgi:hypothetical protein
MSQKEEKIGLSGSKKMESAQSSDYWLMFGVQH